MYFAPVSPKLVFPVLGVCSCAVCMDSVCMWGVGSKCCCSLLALAAHTSAPDMTCFLLSIHTICFLKSNTLMQIMYILGVISYYENVLYTF